MIMLTLLILSITVHASSFPFAEIVTTEQSPLSSRQPPQQPINPNNFNIIKPTKPSANGNNSIHQQPSKPDNDENLLRITLDMNGNDEREIVDQDMGKYIRNTETKWRKKNGISFSYADNFLADGRLPFLCMLLNLS